MHTSFNGLSMVKPFSISELTGHLESLCEAEAKHLDVSINGINRVNGSADENVCSESQALYIGLIENRLARYQECLNALNVLALDTDTLNLDISKDLSFQVLDIYTALADAEDASLKAVEPKAKP